MPVSANSAPTTYQPGRPQVMQSQISRPGPKASARPAPSPNAQVLARGPLRRQREGHLEARCGMPQLADGVNHRGGQQQCRGSPRRHSRGERDQRAGEEERAAGAAARRIGGADRAVTSRVTHIDPPRAWGVQGIDGQIRATVDLTVEPLSADRSRLSISVEFTGHGIGKLLVPLIVRRQARTEMPANLAALKRHVEAR